MKSNKKQINAKTRELKNKKKTLKIPDEPEYETTSVNYFRLLKEMEKQDSDQKLNEELKQKDQKKQKKKNLNEIIYEKNSKKLGNYYNKNKNDLLLYGSRKYDIVSMDKLLKEMGQYQTKVINKINENKFLKSSNNSEIDDIVDDYNNCKNKVILTPLAENEKERDEMENKEKKDFDEAKRMGVVMRKIEYTNLLDNRKNLTDNEENKEMLSKLKTSIHKIEKCWLRHKNKKIEKMKMNSRRGHIEIEYRATNNNIKKLENLGKKYDELNKMYQEALKEIERLNSENEELQKTIEDNNENYKNELNDINNKLNDKNDEYNNLEQIYNQLILKII